MIDDSTITDTPRLNRKPLSLLALVGLVTFLKDAEKPGFLMGAWHGGETKPNGHITFPFYSFSESGQKLFDHVYRSGLVQLEFDWIRWSEAPRGRELFASCREDGFAAIRDTATLDDLVCLITAIFRADKYCDGTVVGEFEAGRLQVICRRANEIMMDMFEAGQIQG